MCVGIAHSEEADSTTVSGPQAQPDSPTKSAPQVKANSPTRAMIRSLALPGWGQFYNGKKLKGSLIAVAEVSSAVAFFVRRDQINDEIPVAGQPPKRNFFLLSTIGVVFYSVVDAFVDAHLDGFDWGQLEYQTPGRKLSLKLMRRF